MPIIILIFCKYFCQSDHFFNLFYISIGLSGVVAGFFATSIHRTSLTTGQKFSPYSVILYYLNSFLGRDNVLPYIFGIISVLFCVYSFASILTPRNFVTHVFTILGKYTLICYLSQILFLQILYQVWESHSQQHYHFA